MKIKNILISQPTPAVIEKSPYYEIFKQFGIKVDYHPFIKIEGVSVKEFRSQRIEILEHTAVIFTSRTTVDHFFRICEEARINVPETMKYFCSTEAVALYLQKYIIYRKRKIFFADGKFENLMQLILKNKTEKMLLILSEPYNPELPDTMAKFNLDFDKVVLSRTVSADLSDIDLKNYDLMAFFSHSDINVFLSQALGDSKPVIATFGETTTRAALDAGLDVGLMAPTPDAPSMAKAIENYLKKINKGEEPDIVKLRESSNSEAFIKAQESKPIRKARTKTS